MIAKQESMWPEFLSVFFMVIFTFAMILGYFSTRKEIKAINARSWWQERNLKLVDIAFGDLSAAAENMVDELKAVKKQALADYIETDDRFEEITDKLELAETLVPIYERRLSEVERWRKSQCFVTC